jgi:integrase/recombinase XerD
MDANMSSIIPFDQAKSLQVKNENDLPPHVTFEQFQRVYNNLTGIDQVLWGLLWETGGRITAVLSLRWIDIDINGRELKLLVQKKKKITTIRIPLSNAMLNDLRNYMIYVKPDSQDYLFNTNQYKREKSKVGRLTRQGAYDKINKWGKKYLNISIHPHMMRHGLAVYLLSQNVPIPIISRRLGHSNVFITQKSYLVITPEIDRRLTENIPMR